ncbi:Phosphoribosylglycinamide formyltransferase [BD1-7 clade bacterium]|uniref:Phosphoribosylglycinamide formyltransferase n=1 Tax=BD1-7 clade bacterium TaxID=2029982 RepID=A0A5S9PVN2_9GAMM|nr:Phosphoribosylglycinamide formyltransferase [BD1-7 clade bacterium]CAA0109601.1 Phosphoribosylglycinamide formyltransferase [BD1-7 clade bacterium]
MPEQDKPRLVVLISGSGSNLQAFIDQCADGTLPADLVAVISNRPDVKGLERAEHAGIPAITIDHKEFDSREAFDIALTERIDALQPDLVILAGFMRILTQDFVSRFMGKLLNIHPSLLPKYPGLNTHQRAIDAGDAVAGATVHFVTPELDGGPPVLRAEIPIESTDTADALAAKTLVQEHKIYPLAAHWFINQRLKLQGGNAYLDDECLSESGKLFTDTLLEPSA